MLSMEVPLFRVRKGLRVVFREQAEAVPISTRKPCPGALSLALGHRILQTVENREVFDFTELARRMNVSQARVSMLVALTFLAPDIQEELLRGEPAVAHLNIHHLLLVARLRNWAEQRAFWNGMKRGVATS